jgi:hypothetical protein
LRHKHFLAPVITTPHLVAEHLLVDVEAAIGVKVLRVNGSSSSASPHACNQR